MSIAAGCDVGSLTAKAVIMKEGEVVSSDVMRAKARPEESARTIMERALTKIDLTTDDIDYCVGTGYGRRHIPFIDKEISEIACHGKGAVWLMPSVKTIIDIGGQDAKGILIDRHGDVQRYSYNDRCASGTGRFLEVMAEALEIELEDFGPISLSSSMQINLTSQCTVFAETEVISLVNSGEKKSDIVRGLHAALARRVVSLVKGVGVQEDVTFTGGVAKNVGIYDSLESELGVKIMKYQGDPQLNGALGAAVYAEEFLASRMPCMVKAVSD